MNLDVFVNNVDGVIGAEVRAQAGLKEEIQKTLIEASEMALNMMRLKVPKSRETYSNAKDPFHKTIYSSLARGNLSYHPGGAGGGGQWEINVGTLDPPEHLEWVVEGTEDIFSSKGNLGPLMAIQKMGEPVKFRRARRGQKPQTEWITDAQAATNTFISQRIERMRIFD